jgi:hypothetical protein
MVAATAMTTTAVAASCAASGNYLTPAAGIENG